MKEIEKITEKKRKGKKLNRAEIEFFVNGYTSGALSDEEMTELLKAICEKGMTEKETVTLTTAMLNSGNKIDLSDLGVCLDKHSSGGVSDSTTLILAPILASLGLKIVKMSGRSLGFTGGTIDKFETFGTNTSLSLDEAKEIAQKVGAVILCQTENLVPADKKLYALRDRTGTVASMPLIASSIVSKKLASGAKIIVLDVKYGEGAFMNNLIEAKNLASLMVKVLKKHKILACAVVSDMNQPLGYNIGNFMEVKEVIEELKHNTDSRLLTLSKTIASLLVSMKEGISLNAASKKVEFAVSDGLAYEKLKEMVIAQGGNLDMFKEEKLSFVSVPCEESGFVKSIKTKELGELTHEIARIKGCKGIKVLLKVGDRIRLGEEMIRIYAPKKYADMFYEKFKNTIVICKEKVQPLPLIYDILD
ncbi:MAG TPA: thymidine phosphorylase [Candidatus Caccopulliclostridium gallistercoris]|uniref:Pyrimidine-nucleoside phosphorylase n=1 Tax=Candidatus Caccopulliclostridium gallistercoris TaxID=2840719 RepID=A0A9D1SXR5_9FIRM|nr:thymidine phosphorylase [Candidatus Caccopulliclostridium gallistercoris]